MIQLELHCPKCESALSFLLPHDNLLNLSCPRCAADIGKSTPATGFLYVLRNDSMTGLLKIGFTTRTVEQRVSELDSSTATPTPFEIAFYFACSEPQSDEALAHETFALHRLNQGREFFKLSEQEALLSLRATLSRREVFLNEGLRSNSYRVSEALKGLEETLINEVVKLKEVWSTTGGASKGISLIYRLISERRYLAAKQIVNLFLVDNPEHGVAISLKEQINNALNG